MTSAPSRMPVYVSTPEEDAVQVSTQFFLNKLLPPLPSDVDLDELIEEKLSRGTRSSPITMHGRLWGYAKKNPSGIHSKDIRKAYTHLETAIRAFVRSVDPDKAVLEFRRNARPNPQFRNRRSDSLPDAYFTLRSSAGEEARWENIAVVGEFLRSDETGNAEENVEKVFQSLKNCMCRNARRRFAYGFTVEDAQMRMWYCDRYVMIVSCHFDFIEDHQTLLHFVLALTYAEEHELGWDPTMSIVDSSEEDSDGPRYDIIVHDADGGTKMYRTLKLLFDANKRQRLFCRGTRVWKVVCLENGDPVGNPVVLKDAWVEHSRERQGAVYDRICRSHFLAEHRDLMTHLVSVERHGDVLVDGAKDCTRLFAMKNPAGDQAENSSPSSTAPEAPHFVHYRIVFGDLGIPLSKVDSLRTAFYVLADAVTGVEVIHKTGFVHRDLSPGNILMVNGQGKITDVEYATAEGDVRAAGRTGTRNFQAVEVECRSYLYAPPPPTPPEVSPEPEESREDFHARRSAIERAHWKEVGRTRLKFTYNCLHDLESLWWIAVYFVFQLTLPGLETLNDGLLEPQRNYASCLFYSQIGRMNAMNYDSEFSENVTSLHPSLLQIGKYLEDLRSSLMDAYDGAESEPGKLDLGVVDSLYEQFHSLFIRIAEEPHTEHLLICL